jgi:hypothetical protein
MAILLRVVAFYFSQVHHFVAVGDYLFFVSVGISCTAFIVLPRASISLLEYTLIILKWRTEPVAKDMKFSPLKLLTH